MADDLRSVFIPALATLLAQAEREAGRPLSEAEVLAIRDGGRCVATPAGAMLALDAERGYREFDPDDAWADWHRLRAQLVGGALPTIVLCLLGDAQFASRAAVTLTTARVEHEVQGREPVRGS